MQNNTSDIGIEKILEDALRNEIPVSATIELLTVCNWRCKHCYIPNHNDKGMSYEQITNILDDLRDIGVFQLVLTGGELLLRNDILDIVEYARNKHFRVNILSNSSLMTDEIAARLAELYITDYSLTIFSLDEEIHDGITNSKGSLKATLRAVEILNKFKIPIEIKTPLLSANYKEFIKVKEFCDNNGFMFTTSPCIFPKIDGDMSPLNFTLDSNQLNEIIVDSDKAVNYKALYEIPYYMCATLRHSLAISSNGDVFPCNSFYKKVGNILETSIKEIWSSELYSSLRNLKSSDSKYCNDCELVSFCEKCPGTIYSETNDVYGCSAIGKNIAKARINNYKKVVRQ